MVGQEKQNNVQGRPNRVSMVNFLKTLFTNIYLVDIIYIQIVSRYKIFQEVKVMERERERESSSLDFSSIISDECLTKNYCDSPNR